MKKLSLLLFLFSCAPIFTQGQSNVSTFHRLIVYNADNEIMLVKIKDTDIWVTPGFYQDSVQFSRRGLFDIAATYGMTISDPELKGTFSMRRENEGKTEMLIRNIYHCHYLSGEVHFPQNQPFELDDIKWLKMKEAVELISFESIRMFIQQTHDNPKQLSGGSLHAVRVDDKWNYEVVEGFYPLFRVE